MRCVVLLFALLVGCIPERTGPDGPEPCGVNTVTQAVYEPPRSIHFLVSDDAGSRECIPGAGAACDTLIADECLVQGSAIVGEQAELEIQMFNPSATDSVTITNIELSGDPSFALLDTPTDIAPASAASARIRYTPTSATTHLTRLVVLSDAANADEDGAVTLPVEGTGAL